MRRSLAADDPSGARFTDITGELTAVDETGATIDGRDGSVFVAWTDVVAAKEIPPRSERPGRPHRTISIDDLQRLMVDGLPGLLQLPIGDWLLRTAEGFTGRANSALAVGDPGMPVADAVDRVAAAYADLGRPALFQLAGPRGFDPHANPVAEQVLARGGRVFQHTLVMTAAVAEVALARPAPNTAVEVTPTPSAQWWTAASPRTVEHRELVERLLAKVDYGRYLAVHRRAGDTVAAGRAALSPGWVGLYDLHTVPDQRGNGFARALVGEAARDAHEHGLRSAYLQVSADNEAAIGLYESLGFTTHHDYWYARLD